MAVAVINELGVNSNKSNKLEGARSVLITSAFMADRVAPGIAQEDGTWPYVFAAIDPDFADFFGELVDNHSSFLGKSGGEQGFLLDMITHVVASKEKVERIVIATTADSEVEARSLRDLIVRRLRISPRIVAVEVRVFEISEANHRMMLVCCIDDRFIEEAMNHVKCIERQKNKGSDNKDSEICIVAKPGSTLVFAGRIGQEIQFGLIDHLVEFVAKSSIDTLCAIAHRRTCAAYDFIDCTDENGIADLFSFKRYIESQCAASGKEVKVIILVQDEDGFSDPVEKNLL